MKIDVETVNFLDQHVVKPMIEAIRNEIKPVIDNAAQHEARITKLEGNQKKALTGWTAMVSVASTGLALLASQAKGWFNRKVGGK